MDPRCRPIKVNVGVKNDPNFLAHWAELLVSCGASVGIIGSRHGIVYVTDGLGASYPVVSRRDVSYDISMDIDGKNVLIVGGQRVGQVVADELLSAGATVIMTYLKDSAEVAANTQGYPLDLTDDASVEKFTTTLAREFTAIDSLVLMASVFAPDPAMVTPAVVRQALAVMVGNITLARWFAETARGRNAKSAPIVAFIDWAVDHPYADYDLYLAGKAALRHYLMALQTSFAGTVRVVNIHPGLLLEPAGLADSEKETIIANTPTHSIGDPAQAARLVRTALENDFLVDNIHLAGGQHWRHRL